MRKLLLLATALALYPAALPQAPTEPDTQKPIKLCSVEGTVVAAGTGEALKSAQVDLSSYKLTSFSSSTDEHGHFRITDVRPGSYLFRAAKSGYAEQAYRPEPDGPPAMLELDCSKNLEGVLFRLSRAGVILGRVVNEDGEPVAGVQMDAWPAPKGGVGLWKDPYNPFRSLYGVKTNDLGEYRLYGLLPGSYYVQATDEGESGVGRMPAGKGFYKWTNPGHPQVYFPGVGTLAAAQKITIRAGQEIRADFFLRPEKAYRISGDLKGADGKPAEYREIHLAEYDVRKGSILPAHSFEEFVRDDGSFEFKTVAPGCYVIWAVSRDDKTTYWVRRRIEVAAADVKDLHLQLRAGLEISGKVIFSAEKPRDLEYLTINLTADGESAFNANAFTHVENDGSFKVNGLRNTVHQLYLSGLPDGWYVRKATFGTQNVLETGLNLEKQDTRHLLTVTLSPGAGQIDGIVLQNERPAGGAFVKLFPVGANPGVELNAWTDKTGRFSIANVPPGDYVASAMPAESDDFINDDELFPGSSPRERFTVHESESKKIEIRLNAESK